jgi:hypothetical protein
LSAGRRELAFVLAYAALGGRGLARGILHTARRADERWHCSLHRLKRASYPLTAIIRSASLAGRFRAEGLSIRVDFGSGVAS